MSHMQTEWGTYLCSYHGGMFQAIAGSIDRTREVLCPNCSFARDVILARDEQVDETRLRWMSA
jgi:DNA-directed RNA polymerase subunit RPC12/RpoP